MIRALIATMATAAVSAAVYRAFQQGKFDSLIDRLTRALQPAPPPLAEAYAAANVSRPAPAPPWPVDPHALPKAGDGDHH